MKRKEEKYMSEEKTEGLQSKEAIIELGSSLPGREARLMNYTKAQHPSKNLEIRENGYGIGGGYERKYGEGRKVSYSDDEEPYGPLSHGGYYGAIKRARRFEIGQAGFGNELNWYRKQYGENTSKYEDEK